MTPHRVDRLRIRQGRAGAALVHRLTRVAHTHLPRALDRALTGAADVVVDRVVVRFPADPTELDDETLAALWASLIRDAVTAAPPASPPPTPPPAAAPAPERATTARAHPTPAAPPPGGDAAGRLLPTGTRPWQRAHAQPRRPRTARSATEPTPAPAPGANPAPPTHHAATPDPAPSRYTRAPGPSGLSTDGPGSAAAEDDRAATPPNPRRDRSATPAGPVEQRSAEPRPASTSPGRPRRTRHLPPRPPRTAPVPSWERDGVPVSAYGGLALLYVRLRPALDPDEFPARLAVLAQVADQEPEVALGDPLVRLLAGDPGWQVPRPLSPPALPRAPEAADRATAVLAAFAGDLAGFAGSSAEFVRAEWVARPAVLIADGPDVLLRLGRRPLDLVLDRLPYPVGVFRFPWTPVVLVGWEAS